MTGYARLGKGSADMRAAEKYGRWTLTEGAVKVAGKWYVSAKCDCGTEKIVNAYCILVGDSKSCGCLNRELAASRAYRHGARHSGLYGTWYALVRRCTNEMDAKYLDYGGRGITVYESWREDVGAFVEYINEHLGPKPEPGWSLDRIDNNRGYEPGNLRWASPAQQSANRRKTARLSDLAVAQKEIERLRAELARVA